MAMMAVQGVLLSQASVERLGGEVTLTGSTSPAVAEGQGTRLVIRFPLQENSTYE